MPIPDRSTPAPSPARAPRRRDGWLALCVAAITLAVYLPAVFHPFVEWDDVTFLAANPRFNPPTAATVAFYWGHAGENLYMPITYTLWAGIGRVGYLDASDAAGTRLNPYLFHLASVLLHAAAAAAVYLLLQRALESSGQLAAAAGALLFALHPLQVESVAFIGTMNTPLAAALGLWAVWLFVRSGDESGKSPTTPRWRRPSYWIALLLFLAAMLSKPTAVAMPAIALLLEMASGTANRRLRDSAIALLPWLALAALCTLWARHVQPAAAVPATPLWFRPAVAGDAALFYLRKLLLPTHLGIDYGRAPAWLAQQRWPWLGAAAAGAMLVAAAMDWASAKRRRAVIGLAILLFFVGMLPNAGLIPFDYQQFSTAADRYAYLAMIGPALAVAGGWGWLERRRRGAMIAGIACAAVGIALVVQTERQIAVWRDGRSLFRHAIAVNPRSWLSYGNLAVIDADTNPTLAMAECETALRLNPADASAWNTLGSLQMDRGDAAAAVRSFGQAHALAPGDALLASNWRRAVAALGRGK